jgi:hypothetical protein
MNKLCRAIWSRSMIIVRWLLNNERIGFYGLIVAIISLFVGVWSLNASRDALEISKKTSIRDSITSIQDDKNRINDSTLTRYNNDRDSAQQGEMVILLEKYNKLADGQLKAQVDAGKPKFNTYIISITDTDVKTDIEGLYRIPFFEFDYNNYANRLAFNLRITYKLYYPKSKLKYFGSITEQTPVGQKPLRGYFIPVVPVIDKDYFFIKLSLKWEDHLLGNRIDSINFAFVSTKIESSNFLIGNVSNDNEINRLRELEKSAKLIDFSMEKLTSISDVFYRTRIKQHIESRNK